MQNTTVYSLEQPDIASDASTDDEDKMRRALGLGPQPASFFPQPSPGPTDRQPHRRRFVRDGEVPVVLVGRGAQPTDRPPTHGIAPVNKLALVETARRSEQEARQHAERALTDAQATIRDLQTKLGHALLERDEVRDTARRLETDKLALTSALDAERIARQKAEEEALQNRSGGRSVSETVPTGPVGRTAQDKAARPKNTRLQPKARKPEPKPVKWWLTSK